MAAPADTALLRITQRLHSTLELHKLLALFGDEAAAVAPHDGLGYEYAEDNYRIDLGEPGAHQCHYQLDLADTQLGELTVHRQTPFSADEQAALAELVTALIYPVRNALLYRQAVQQAHRDPLTGIGNRAAMDKALEQEHEMARRHRAPLSVIILDIDRFKPVNDTYGHITGDSVLRSVSACMVERMRRSDIIYRYGGEEFLILLRNTTPAGAALLAERIRVGIEKIAIGPADMPIKITISAGIAALQDEEPIASLLTRCDKALYRAKQQGRNRVVVG